MNMTKSAMKLPMGGKSANMTIAQLAEDELIHVSKTVVRLFICQLRNPLTGAYFSVFCQRLTDGLGGL